MKKDPDVLRVPDVEGFGCQRLRILKVPEVIKFPDVIKVPDVQISMY